MGDDEQPRINTYNMCRLRLIDERIALYVENSHVRLIPLRATLPLPLYAAGTPLWVGSPLAVWTADANPLTVGHETAWCIAWSRLIRLNCTVLVCHPPPPPLSATWRRCQPCAAAPSSPPTQWGLLLGCPPPETVPACRRLPSHAAAAARGVAPAWHPPRIYLSIRQAVFIYVQRKTIPPLSICASRVRCARLWW